MMKNTTVVDKELSSLIKKRTAYLKQYATKKEIAPELAEKIPAKLRSTLNAAFCKAFEVIYKNGTPLIDKTYNKQNAEQQYQINRFAYEVRQNKKSLRALSRQSNMSNSINLLISGVEGIGLGLVGCGIPDIPLLTAVILRSLYEISTNFGYDYIEIPIFDFSTIALHGHTINNIENSLKDLSFHKKKFYSTVFMGHFHAGKKITVGQLGNNDCEIVICPSFVGDCPYSDKIMKGAKAASCIYGFDKKYGLVETYKIILN